MSANTPPSVPNPAAPVPAANIPAARAGAVLTIDLNAITANYHSLTDRLGGVKPSAVVKADAYGLGAGPVAITLANAGCRVFFVAHLEEGIRLRHALNEAGDSNFVHAEIHILGGLMPDSHEALDSARLIPVLGSLDDIHSWKQYCERLNRPLPCDIHADTGMARLGLPPGELDKLESEPSRLEGLNVHFVLSHLARADEPDHAKNAEQLEAFQHVRQILPHGRASLANSSGIFLGSDYHFDLARPGAALYGIAPVPGQANPMAQVIRLQGKIAQLRSVDTPQTVGYGSTHRVEGPARIATVAVGYADGYLRSLSNKGTGYIGNIPVPVVGRVSMDLITLDVSDVPEHLCTVGTMIDLIGPNNPVDQLADEAGTIGYEILTSLGHRYHRVYTGGQKAGAQA
ncbi:MAG: alanine racemase [Rhodospirillales bacterium]|nr:alanine racemase [Alphaproteobacteria bacterium]MBL6947536.1 alanine racemase [Rhodospirillales bacterium]